MDAINTSIHKLWNKFAALTLNMGSLDELLPTLEAIHALVKTHMENRPLAHSEDKMLSRISTLDTESFFSDLTTLIQESSLCITQMKEDFFSLTQALDADSRKDHST